MKHTTQADTTFFFFLNILLSAQFIARYRVVENVRPDFEGPSRQLSKSSACEKNQVQ